MKSIILALILCESGFNPNAYNPAGPATGLMQLTKIGVKEASIQCKLPKNPNLHDPKINLIYGKCLFNYYLKISKSEIEAVIMYHSGFDGRAKFRNGKSAGPKTDKYVLKVFHYKERFQRGKINLKHYCNKYPSISKFICPNYSSKKR